MKLFERIVSNRQAVENKTADKNICETEGGGSILSPRRVAKILEEKTISRFLFDILHQWGKLDLSCDNTLFTVQAIDPFEETNPFSRKIRKILAAH